MICYLKVRLYPSERIYSASYIVYLRDTFQHARQSQKLILINYYSLIPKASTQMCNVLG